MCKKGFFSTLSLKFIYLPPPHGLDPASTYAYGIPIKWPKRLRNICSHEFPTCSNFDGNSQTKKESCTNKQLTSKTKIKVTKVKTYSKYIPWHSIKAGVTRREFPQGIPIKLRKMLRTVTHPTRLRQIVSPKG